MTNKETVSLSINGATVEAEKGRLLIDVAEQMGVFVPRFCYHPGMKSVAVCRMCLVKIEGRPKLAPACATEVSHGLKVDTVDPEAVDAQSGMLEFLLINHPLDCPICDRAGECPLQDQTYRHGPGSSRYIEPKRTYEKALEISQLIVLDRERCVLCWRCVRFSDEIAGDAFIQLVDRGPGTQILTFSDEPFDSYFSGNTIQICPVGALTSKPYRFMSRPWDLKTSSSVCSYCAVGCPITNEARSEQLVRCQALPNEKVNDFWICDKGRFGYHHVSAPDRLTTPLIRSDRDEFEPATWGRAVDRIAAAVKGGKQIGVLAGGHLSTEDAFAIGRLADKVLGTPNVDSRMQDAHAPYELTLEFGSVLGSTATINDLEDASTIVWVGPDPKETLPVLYLRLRQAVIEHSARLITVSPRAISLDAFATRTLRVAPGREADALYPLGAEVIEGSVVVCWGPSAPGRDESHVLAAALGLVEETGGLFLMCPPHAGSQGMLDMGVHPAVAPGYRPRAERGLDTRAILEAAAEGRLDALLLFGVDPLRDFPDGSLAERALRSRAFTITIELFPTASVALSDVVLPSVAYAEREATLTNLERRLQKLEPLLEPPGSAREPWRICASLAQALGHEWSWRTFEDVWRAISAEVPTHAGIDVRALAHEMPAPGPQYESQFESDPSHATAVVAGPGGQYPKGFRSGAPFHTGQNWPLSWELRAFDARQRPGIVPEPPARTDARLPPDGMPPEANAPHDGTLALYSGRQIYDEGAMVSRSKALQALQKKPFVELNERDAARLGLSAGDLAMVRGGGFEVRLPVVIGDIAAGAVFIPYDQDGLHANGLMSGINPRVEVTQS